VAIRAAQIQADADELKQDALLTAFPEGRAYSPRALARTRLYSNEVLWGPADLRHQLPSGGSKIGTGSSNPAPSANESLRTDTR
jgi:hypothetical protein